LVNHGTTTAGLISGFEGNTSGIVPCLSFTEDYCFMARFIDHCGRSSAKCEICGSNDSS